MRFWNSGWPICSVDNDLSGVIAMFVNSEQLKNRIQIVSDEIVLRSNGKISFEEYIALPYYGYIILRFNLYDDHFTIADLDRYEAMMYDCVKDEFLIDFMGDVYRNVGIDYRKMDKLFADCFNFYSDEKLFKSVYADRIDKDSKHLLALCGLSTDLPVWEIQIEDEMRFFLLGDRNESLGQYCKNGMTINVYRIASKSCEGLIAAAFYAKRNNISLVNALMKVQEAI